MPTICAQKKQKRNRKRNQRLTPKLKKMYSLEGTDKFFEDIQDLCQYVLDNGICPETQILYNGEPVADNVSDYLVP